MASPLQKRLILLGVKPSMRLSGNTAEDDDTVGTVVGTLTILGRTSGTPSWSLTDDASGKYAVDSSTGVVTVADTLTAGTDTITAAVSGVTPAVASKSFDITVTAVSAAPVLMDSQYIPGLSGG